MNLATFSFLLTDKTSHQFTTILHCCFNFHFSFNALFPGNDDKFLFFVFRESALSDLKGEATGLREAMAKLHSERADLMQKIQDGGGTNAALQQLKEQNVILSN